MINRRKTIAHFIDCDTHDRVPGYGVKVRINFRVICFGIFIFSVVGFDVGRGGSFEFKK
jgi:hypothetical protein